jgi:F-type H+-transporting ATPase subunit b
MFIQLFIIQVVTFAAFMILMRFLFSRNLSAALNRLNLLHEENLVKETQLTEELKRAKEEKEAEIAKGKSEASVIIEEARSEAVKLRRKMEDEANLQVDKIIAQSKEEIERLKGLMKAEMRNKSFELAGALLVRVFTEHSQDALQEQFINEIIEEISKVPREKFGVSISSGGTVKIISSRVLQDVQRENLKAILENKLGSAAVLEERVDQTLIFGLILEIGGLVIDGTLRNKLRRAVASIKQND